jgi:hypothetical protein
MAMVADPIQKPTTTFHDALAQAELLARQHLPEVLHERLRCAALLIKEGKVLQMDDGHTWEVESASVAGKIYSINGAGCSCEDAQYRAPQARCKHLLATLLVRKALALMGAEAAQTETEAVAPPEDAPAAEPHEPVQAEVVRGIDPKWLTTIHGKPHVRYMGLLAMAHERGIKSIAAKFISVTPEMALAEATRSHGRVPGWHDL